MRFEWDERKSELNIRKHKVSFELAAMVFSDPKRLEFYDDEHSTWEEERYITIGAVQDITLLLTVVYTPRQNCIRIISAWKASKTEREMYKYGNQRY